MKLAQLTGISTVNQLAAQLGYTYSDLSQFIYGATSSSSYRVFQVPKRAGGYRTIAAPRAELKAIQRQILEALTEAYHPTRSAFGFVRGRSIVSGAAPHVGRRIVVNVDLADFFPTISFRRVRGLFLSPAFNLPYDVATVLAQICCRQGQLPQGAPTSPLISNFITSAMDRELGALVGASGGQYTRYCDDITMSFGSEGVVAKAIATKSAAGFQLNPSIENVIKKHGFFVNQAKLKVRTRRERQEVTGLVVNQRINVRREFVRLLHTHLHCVEKFGIEAASSKYYELTGKSPDGQMPSRFAAEVRGRILFVKMVRGDGDKVFAALARRFNRTECYPKRISYFRRAQSVADLQKAVWVVEVSYDDPDWGFLSSQGTAFLLEGVGLVTCAHVVVNDGSRRPFREIEVFRTGSLRRYRAYVASFDPSNDLAVLYVEGLNYVADCDVRFQLAQQLGFMGQQVQMVGFPSYRDGQSPFIAGTEVAAVHGDLMEVGGQVIGGISGGPLLDADFRVVGILTRGVPGGGPKNEAIKADKAFRLSFRSQDLRFLQTAKKPSQASPVRAGFIAWVRSKLRI